MSALAERAVSDALRASVDSACDRIAPTWPLDQFIAVNPYWGWRRAAIADAAAQLGTLGGTSLTMPRSWFRDQWAHGRLTERHLEVAAGARGDGTLAAEARAVLESAAPVDPPRHRVALITDQRDLGPGPRPGQSWTELVVHQISQHCAAHFDLWQSSWHLDDRLDLYGSWRRQLTASHGVAWRHGASWARAQITSLPHEPIEAIARMLGALAIPDDGYETYLTSCLLSINGWAAWCAYRRWQARLTGGDDTEIVALLAVRVAWEWLLHLDAEPPEANHLHWAKSWSGASSLAAATAAEQRVDWVLQTAAEHSYQDEIIAGLGAAAPPPADTPAVQAVFCIDVRSEVMRRAIEAATPQIHTRGFAGFFGLPIAYTPAGSALSRPQLPGLLAPVHEVTDHSDSRDRESITAERDERLDVRQRWSRFTSSPASMFSFVESIGLTYAPKLLKHTLPATGAPHAWEHEGLSPATAQSLRPRLALTGTDPAAGAAIARNVLRAMGLIERFAPIVLLCGHGSQSENNPHAAGLDCGACGGQTGEVNARVLADLLNAPGVRRELAAGGISVPDTTWFVPALHNTTTDDVSVLDREAIPATHADALAALERWLRDATERARAERAVGLGLGHLADHPRRLEQAILQRANDWSQVRPEWGLAGNAAFIVAPRARTRHLDLRGRVFLHDYDWRRDDDRSVLTLIMTAPMIVTNWINLQYYASTVDNRRYGSGNKVLHNVVGGRIGVFEGNGGDLRIGLAEQSLHDGTALRHEPLRLSVFIEAPRDGIDAVIAEHDVVHDLVANGWLHLLRIESADGSVERWTRNGWLAA